MVNVHEIQPSTVEFATPSPYAFELDEITSNFPACENQDEVLSVSNALTRLIAAEMEPQDIAQLLAHESHGVLPTHEHITSLFRAHPDYFDNISPVEKRFFLFCGLSYGISTLQNKQVSRFKALTPASDTEICELNEDIQNLERLRTQVFQTGVKPKSSNLLGNSLGE